jgi:predicted TIM-barrel fold metal-dependent hydrolase
MIELVGADRVVIGSDNYAKMEVDQPNALVGQVGLPPDDLMRIMRGNAAKLFRFAKED